MGHTLSYRSCQPADPDREAAIRQAADVFNQGQPWILSFTRDERDGNLLCGMYPNDALSVDRPAKEESRWPGPYEAKRLLDALCGISRECNVDWEVWATYSPRPVGVIRDGVCHADQEAHTEAVRAMGARLDQRGGN